MDFYAVEVQLTTGKNVIITTKWEESEVEVEIFQENAELVLKGRKKLSDMEKQCKILSLQLNDVKDALTSNDSLIQYEINDSQTKLTILKNEFLSQDSQNEINIIMFFVALVEVKVDTYNVIKQFACLNQDLRKQVEEQTKLYKQVEESVITATTRSSSIALSNVEFKAKVYNKFITLLNTKKKKIDELTRKLEIATIKGLGSGDDVSNYILNISSGSEIDKPVALQPKRLTTPKRKRTPIKPKVGSPLTKKALCSRNILQPKEDLFKFSINQPSPKKHPTPSKPTSTFKSLFQFKRITKNTKFDSDSPPKENNNLPKPFINDDAMDCEAGPSKPTVQGYSSDSSFGKPSRAASVCSVRSEIVESAQVMEIDSSLDNIPLLDSKKYLSGWASDSSTDIEKTDRKLRSTNGSNGKPAGSEDLFLIDEVVPNSQEYVQQPFESSYSKRRNSLKYQSPRSNKKPKSTDVNNYDVDTIPILK
ncbi:unnamed protein product [Diamesa hyperborea]